MKPKRFNSIKEYQDFWSKQNSEYWKQHDPYLENKIKVCSKCKLKKSSFDFARDYRSKTGLQGYCKICEGNRRRIQDDPIQIMLSNAKQRAKRKKLDFDLNKSDISIPEYCPILGIPLVIWCGQQTKIAHDDSPSLDRIDSSKGYTKDNIQIISWRANNLKKNASLDELKKIVKYMENKNE